MSSKVQLYSQLHKLCDLIYSTNLTAKSDCDKLSRQLKKAVEFLERKENP